MFCVYYSPCFRRFVYTCLLFNRHTAELLTTFRRNISFFRLYLRWCWWAWLQQTSALPRRSRSYSENFGTSHRWSIIFGCLRGNIAESTRAHSLNTAQLSVCWCRVKSGSCLVRILDNDVSISHVREVCSEHAQWFVVRTDSTCGLLTNLSMWRLYCITDNQTTYW